MSQTENLDGFEESRENELNGFFEERHEHFRVDNDEQGKNLSDGQPENADASGEENDEEPLGPSRKRKAYLKDFKLEAVKYAKDISARAAAKKYGVTRKMLREWSTKEGDFKKQSSQAKRLKGAGRHLTSMELENEVMKWIKEQRAAKLPVSRSLIRDKASRLREGNNNEFSEGWLDKFLKRNNFTQRVPTSVAQKPPEYFEDVIVNFLMYLSQLRRKEEYELIYACDETGVWLDPIGAKCIEKKGSKEVTVLSTGHEKTRITVMLTGRSDGVKCRPFVLLNKKRPDPAIEKRFKGDLNLVWCGKTWFDDRLTSLYLERTFGSIAFKKRILVWDSFRCHISADTKRKLKSLKLDTAVVPGGTTKFIQPADLSWNHPFKAKIRRFYEEWMMDGDHQKTKTGNLKAPPMDVYLQWIVDAWKSLPKELIEKSFKTCGITNNVDGSEDDQIHCFGKEGPIPTGFLKLSRARTDQICVELLEQIDLNEDENNEFIDSDDEIMYEFFEKVKE